MMRDTKEESVQKLIRQILEGRAARTIVSAAAVFLCLLTILEFLALRYEWNIPMLTALSSKNGFWSEEFRREELALDESTENEFLENSRQEMEAAEENAQNITVTAGSDEKLFEAELVLSDENKSEEAKDLQTTDKNAAEIEFPYYIRVNRKQNCVTIYTPDNEGEYTVPYKAMICSTGLYNATPRGIFQISTKYRWRELYGGVYGQYATRICGGILFHSVPYYKKSEGTLCTEKYNKLGQQASMGCVRLTVEDAKWIAEYCPEGTTVEIYDDDNPGPLGKPKAAKLNSDSPYKGWDPTDPNEDNPWNNSVQENAQNKMEEKEIM